jgi:hypothetical protein
MHPKHNSKTCNHPAEGHKRDATIDNRMGGNEKYLELVS